MYSYYLQKSLWYTSIRSFRWRLGHHRFKVDAMMRYTTLISSLLADIPIWVLLICSSVNFFAFFYFSFGAYDAQRSWTRILALFWDLGNSKILHRLYSIQVSPYHELNYEHMSSWAEWFYFMPWFDDLSFLEKIFTTNSRSVVFFWIIYCYDFWILNYSSLRVDEAIVTAVQKIWTRPNSI